MTNDEKIDLLDSVARLGHDEASSANSVDEKILWARLGVDAIVLRDRLKLANVMAAIQRNGFLTYGDSTTAIIDNVGMCLRHMEESVKELRQQLLTRRGKAVRK